MLPDPWYIYGSKGDNNYHFELLLEDTITLGRLRTSPVPIASRYASREHLTLSKRADGRWTIGDCGSANGTFLNGTRLKRFEEKVLTENDEIRIGLKDDPLNCFSFKIKRASPDVVKRLNKSKVVRQRDSLSSGYASKETTQLSDTSNDVFVIDSKDPKLKELKPFVDIPPLSEDQAKKVSSFVDLISEDEDEPIPIVPKSEPQPKTSTAVSSVREKRKKDRDSPPTQQITRDVKKLRLTESPERNSDRPRRNSPRNETSLPPKSLPLITKNCNEKTKPDRKLVVIKPLPQTRGRSGQSTSSSRFPSSSSEENRSMARIPKKQQSFEESGISTKPQVSHSPTSQHHANLDPRFRPTSTTTADLLSKQQPSWRERPKGPAPKASRLNVDTYLEMVLKWNSMWLHESLKIKDDPMVADMPLLPLKMTYDTCDEYINTYIPYILFEIWANAAESYHELAKKESALTLQGLRDTIPTYFVNLDKNQHFLQLILEYPVPDGKNKPRRIPGDGDLVLVEMEIFVHDPVSRQDCVQNHMGFGFVSDMTTESRFSAKHKPYKIPHNCSHILRFSVSCKRAAVKINQLSPVKLFKVEYIRPQIKHIEALLTLKNSNLSNDIQRPRKMTCQVPYPRDIELRSNEFNDSQLKAIIGSVEAVKRSKGVPKIALIQGPPGTGKTHTLVGIIKELYSTWSPWDPHNLPKVLICAPSNGAVDEIARRLYAVRKFLDIPGNPSEKRSRSIRLVRVGQDEQVKKEVQHITLDKLVTSNMGKSSAIDTRVKELESRAEALDIEITNLRYKGRMAEADRKQEEMEKVFKEAERARREQQFECGADEHKKRIKRIEILQKADIILSTLNSCRSSIMDNVFNKPNSQVSFSCVIIDEASQCSEPELLMPLFYPSITKMILIGDPMQLPATVKSKRAQAAGYGRSFFERVFHHFGGYESDDNVVHMLCEQYRMHPEICRFPSYKFYADRLMSARTAGIDPTFPIKPYTVLDIKDTHENTTNVKNIHNIKEAMFICTLCKMLQEYVKPQTTVGIITGYQGQKRTIEEKIRNLGLSRIVIDINTVDGFQGQERDIVIFSTVRATDEGNGSIGFMSSMQRTNVALTRSKFACIVCISKKSMEKSPLWKELIVDAESRKCLHEISSAANTATLSETLLLPYAQSQARK